MSNETRNRTPEIQPFQLFCREVGISDVTGWRMRRAGWIITINIAGRPYVTCEAIAEFKRRAAAGEFAKIHKSPLRASAN